MPSFKLFLEASKTAPPNYEKFDLEKAVELFREHCKDAVKMVSLDAPIYRGTSREMTGAFLVDPSKTERISQNTSNYYTMLFDNNPDNSKFPKRGRSFICSTKRYISRGYGQLYALIPFDGVAIGEVHETDFWNLKVNVLGNKVGVETLNSLFSQMNLDATPESFKNVTSDSLSVTHFRKYGSEVIFRKYDEENVDEFLDNFYENCLDLYNGEKLGLSVATTKNVKINEEQEVWVGGKCLMFDFEKTWQAFRMLAMDPV